MEVDAIKSTTLYFPVSGICLLRLMRVVIVIVIVIDIVIDIEIVLEFAHG